MQKGLTHQGTHDLLLGEDATSEEESLKTIDEQLTADYPPTYIWSGDADQMVPPDNTRRMTAALEQAGVPCRCEVFPGVDLGVGPGKGTVAEGWMVRAVDFRQKQKT